MGGAQRGGHCEGCKCGGRLLLQRRAAASVGLAAVARVGSNATAKRLREVFLLTHAHRRRRRLPTWRLPPTSTEFRRAPATTVVVAPPLLGVIIRASAGATNAAGVACVAAACRHSPPTPDCVGGARRLGRRDDLYGAHAGQRIPPAPPGPSTSIRAPTPSTSTPRPSSPTKMAGRTCHRRRHPQGRTALACRRRRLGGAPRRPPVPAPFSTGAQYVLSLTAQSVCIWRDRNRRSASERASSGRAGWGSWGTYTI